MNCTMWSRCKSCELALSCNKVILESTVCSTLFSFWQLLIVKVVVLQTRKSMKGDSSSIHCTSLIDI